MPKGIGYGQMTAKSGVKNVKGSDPVKTTKVAVGKKGAGAKGVPKKKV